MDEYKAKENEFDIAMTEILRENFDTKTQGKDVEEMLYSNDDKIQQLLLDYYNTYDSRHDFQTELIRSLAVKLKLNEEEFIAKKGHDSKEEQDEQIREVAKETQDEEESIDDETKKRAENKIKKDKSKEGLSKNELKAELMKAVYMDVFERYEKALIDYKKVQERKEMATIGDREGTEIILYERYLQKLEKNYANFARANGVDMKDIDADEDIKKKKEMFAKTIGEYDDINDQNVEQNLKRVDELTKKRDYYAGKLAEIIENKDNMSHVEFHNSLQSYNDLYIEATLELNSIKPSLGMYQQNLETEKENMEFYEREIGFNSNERVAIGKTLGDDGKLRKEEHENVEDVVDISNTGALNQENAIDDIVVVARKAFDKYLKTGDMEDFCEAKKAIETAEAVYTGKNVEEEKKEGNERKNNSVREDYNYTPDEKKKEDNGLKSELSSGVESVEMANAKEDLRSRIESLEEKNTANSPKIDNQEFVYERKSGNKK